MCCYNWCIVNFMSLLLMLNSVSCCSFMHVLHLPLVKAYTLWTIKRWQYIFEYNFEKSRSIFSFCAVVRRKTFFTFMKQVAQLSQRNRVAGWVSYGMMIILGSSTWNFESNWPRWSEIANFRSIFARSVSAVTPSEKSSINTNRKSTTRFPMSSRWTSYVVSKLPKGGLKTQSV